MFSGRTRRRGSSAAGSYLYYFTIGVLIIAATVVLAVSIVPSLSFSSVALDRTGNVGTAGDANAVVGLDVASSVTEGSTDRLVSVTNNLDDTADITVSLNDGSQGTLYHEGSSVGDSHTVKLDPGESATFDVQGSIQGGGQDGATSDCSEAEATAQNNGWKVTFYCASYDSSEDETQYKYGVEPIEPAGQMHDLSHIVFGFEDNFDPDVESTSPEAEDEEDGEDDEGDVKTDPVTGAYGLKFDEEISKTGSGQIYTFTIEGHHGTTSEDHGLKAGPDSFTLSLPGPSSSSGPGIAAGGEETITFTVKSESEELTGVIERTTTLEPEPTPTEAPTQTEEEDDEEDDDDGEGGPPEGNPGGGNDDDDEEDD